MPSSTERGPQKQARFERLCAEIYHFVTANPGCSAQAIVASLNHDQKLRNHGLTPRKVGFFITRNLRQSLKWWQDHRAGRRVYGPVDEAGPQN